MMKGRVGSFSESKPEPLSFPEFVRVDSGLGDAFEGFQKDPAHQGRLTPLGRNLDTPVNKIPEHDAQLAQYLGAGSFGQVSLVPDQSGQLFVLKQINLQKSARDRLGQGSPKHVQDEASRAKVEIKALEQVGEHPNIVRFLGSKQTGGMLEIALQHVIGESLGGWEGQLDDAHAVHVMRQILDALNYCHRRGVAHLDLKPQNIIVNSRGHITLIDFGGARLFPKEAANLDPEKISEGTLGYRAPSTETNVIKRDLFSAGQVCESLMQEPKSEAARAFIARCRSGEPIIKLLKDPWLASSKS